MDALTQVQIVFYGFIAFGIGLGLLGLKYLRPEPQNKNKSGK